ncbi:MAG: FG-GAP-like repeat-containing protein, partial [Bryobacteraceae bacterium]
EIVGRGTQWVEHLISYEVIGPVSLDVRDMDGDGDLDVMAGEHNYKDPGAARLLLFENVDGRGLKWKMHVISRGDEHHDGARAVDIDGDGDLDIVSIGSSHPRVLLYENRPIVR